jgi:hypothetical protein
MGHLLNSSLVQAVYVRVCKYRPSLHPLLALCLTVPLPRFGRAVVGYTLVRTVGGAQNDLVMDLKAASKDEGRAKGG